MHGLSTLRRQAACNAWEPSALSAPQAWRAVLFAALAACLAGPESTAAAAGDLPTVSIDYMGGATGIAYEHEPVVFALTRTGDAGEALSVRVEVEETGDMVEEAGEGVQTVTFAAGDGMATFEPAIADDAEDESHSSVSVSIDDETEADYLAGSPDTATVEVRDDDGILVTFSLHPLDVAVNEGEDISFELVAATVDDGTFTSTGDLDRLFEPGSMFFEWVTIQVGEAEVSADFRAFVENFRLGPDDFQLVDGRLVQRRTLRSITIVDDGVTENDERFIARLAVSPEVGYRAGFAPRESVEGISLPLSGPLFVSAVVTVRGDSGDLRLVGGAADHEGRLEIFHAGRWGTVCDDYWTDKDSDVACRQLGYPGAERETGRFLRAHFGQGSGPIWLDNVLCGGDEGRLIDCPRIFEGETIGGHNCTHEEDVGVRCLLEKPACGDAAGAAARQRDGGSPVCPG